MGLSRNELGENEKEILHLRTHAKALIVPVLALLLLAAAAGTAIALFPVYLPTWPVGVLWAFLGIFVVLAWFWVFLPFLRWLTSTYTFTNRRIITRTGIITKNGHDIPLIRVANVEYTRHLIDRILGCGTLVVETSADDPLILPDIPDVERVHVLMTELLFADGIAIDKEKQDD